MRTITQVKMLHDAHPVDQLLGQISRSNAGSKLSVEIVGRICRSNSLVKLPVEIMGQIPGSNPPVKLLVVTSHVTDVTPDVTSKHANQTQPILGPLLANLGERMAMPSNGPKTGKDRRETGKEKPHAATRGACLAWLALVNSRRRRNGPRHFAAVRIYPNRGTSGRETVAS